MSKKKQTPEGGNDPMVGPVRDMYLSPKRQCTAMSKHTGKQCGRYAMRGLRVCVVHGGATRAAKAKAAERIQAASGYAADLLVEFMANPEVEVQLRTRIAQDLLDRSGVNTKSILEIGVEQPKSFLDFVGDALVDFTDAGELTATSEDIVDAEIVESDNERWEREDAADERTAEMRRMMGRAPRLPAHASDLNAERAREEADALRQARPEPTRRASSTADPYADRFPATGRRRTTSPKRYEQRQRERGEG